MGFLDSLSGGENDPLTEALTRILLRGRSPEEVAAGPRGGLLGGRDAEIWSEKDLIAKKLRDLKQGEIYGANPEVPDVPSAVFGLAASGGGLPGEVSRSTVPELERVAANRGRTKFRGIPIQEQPIQEQNRLLAEQDAGRLLSKDPRIPEFKTTGILENGGELSISFMRNNAPDKELMRKQMEDLAPGHTATIEPRQSSFSPDQITYKVNFWDSGGRRSGKIAKSVQDSLGGGLRREQTDPNIRNFFGMDEVQQKQLKSGTAPRSMVQDELRKSTSSPGLGMKTEGNQYMRGDNVAYTRQPTRDDLQTWVVLGPSSRVPGRVQIGRFRDKNTAALVATLDVPPEDLRPRVGRTKLPEAKREGRVPPIAGEVDALKKELSPESEFSGNKYLTAFQEGRAKQGWGPNDTFTASDFKMYAGMKSNTDAAAFLDQGVKAGVVEIVGTKSHTEGTTGRQGQPLSMKRTSQVYRIKPKGAAIAGEVDELRKSAELADLAVSGGMLPEKVKGAAQSLPPVPEGMTRVFRVEGKSAKKAGAAEGVRGGDWFETSLGAYVSPETTPENVLYVDIPTARFKQLQSDPNATEVRLPPGYLARAKPIS